MTFSHHHRVRRALQWIRRHVRASKCSTRAACGVAGCAQRQALQGIESPKGSGQYPEPKWLGMIQHDMMMFDHGMPRPDGTVSKEQRAEADVNIEYQSKSKYAVDAEKLAWHFENANELYA